MIEAFGIILGIVLILFLGGMVLALAGSIAIAGFGFMMKILGRISGGRL